MTDSTKIKSMLLYSDTDRIWNDLKTIGIERSTTDTINVEVLNQFDCYNFSGQNGAKHAAERLKLGKSSHVIDIGSGLGGPARCIANTCGARVTGIELQQDLTMLANELCTRCDLASTVQIIHGSFFDIPMDLNSFDAGVSFLVILHLPTTQRLNLFRKIHGILKPNGSMFIEDFFLKSCDNDFTELEKMSLEKDVYIPSGALPTREEYIATLSQCGFHVVFEDFTEEWTEFTHTRMVNWKDRREELVSRHNEATWIALDHFYTTVATHFKSGKLGGVRMVITKM